MTKVVASRFYCPRASGFFADPIDCSKFYRCMAGRPLHYPCPTGTLWDQNIVTCNHAVDVECFSGHSCPDPDGLFPISSDCGRFLNCRKGIPRVSKCPEGLHFNADVLICDYPMEANCKSFK
ncbi:hypothetical protein SNE40_004124 [Patella caerulea]